MNIAFLHTAQVHVETLKALVQELAPNATSPIMSRLNCLHQLRLMG